MKRLLNSGGLAYILLFVMFVAVVVVAGKLRDQQNAATDASLALCERGNLARPQLIQTYLDIAAGNRARARGYHAELAAGAPPALRHILATEERASAAEARNMIHDAAVIANAQRSVSSHPNAGLRRRSIVDCSLATD